MSNPYLYIIEALFLVLFVAYLGLVWLDWGENFFTSMTYTITNPTAAQYANNWLNIAGVFIVWGIPIVSLIYLITKITRNWIGVR